MLEKAHGLQRGDEVSFVMDSEIFLLLPQTDVHVIVYKPVAEIFNLHFSLQLDIICPKL